MEKFDVAIIGAGPAGLAAAHEATKHGANAVVVERMGQPGGLSRTLQRNGSRFDIGPHRFFTKNQEVLDLFHSTLGADALSVNRLTRILFRNRLFNYPLTPLNALPGVGAADTVGILASYAMQKFRNIGAAPATSFEEWVSREFGPKLYGMFFKTYTEKVWGISCSDISADWAGQRIKGLNLAGAIRNALGGGGGPKSLVNRFEYPRRGAGMLYERLADQLAAKGVAFRYDAKAVGLRHEGGKVRSLVIERGGEREEIEASSFAASSPITEMIGTMSPDAPDAVRRAGASLRYREHLGVHLVHEGEAFPDNWIYVHAAEVKMARVSNFRNFSSEMAAGPGSHPLTVEYFCFKGDAMWRLSDDDLVALAKRELTATKLLPAGRFTDGFVVRSENAYPLIERGYEANVGALRAWLAGFSNLFPIGRSGMFRYNNQDHAIATGLIAARSMLGLGNFDPWNVNIDAEYHEEQRTTV